MIGIYEYTLTVAHTKFFERNKCLHGSVWSYVMGCAVTQNAKMIYIYNNIGVILFHLSISNLARFEPAEQPPENPAKDVSNG